MDTPVATLITEGRSAPTLTETLDGFRGQKRYRVNTTDEHRARLASGLPAMNAPWSSQYPNLLVVERDYEYTHGTDDPVSGTGGWGEVILRYAVVSYGGNIPDVLPAGFKMTQESADETTVQIPFEEPADFDALPAPGLAPALEPLSQAHGGFSKRSGLTQFTVTKILSRTEMLEALLICRRLHQAQAFNAEPVSLPNYLRTGVKLDFEAEQLQFRSYTAARRSDNDGEEFYRLDMTVGYFPLGPYAYSVRVDRKGYAVQGGIVAGRLVPLRVKSRVYETLDFGSVLS